MMIIQNQANVRCQRTFLLHIMTSSNVGDILVFEVSEATSMWAFEIRHIHCESKKQNIVALSVTTPNVYQFPQVFHGKIQPLKTVSKFVSGEMSSVYFPNRKMYISAILTRSSAIAEEPRYASCQLKRYQLPRISAETTCTTSPDQIDVMKLEVQLEAMCNKHVHLTITQPSCFHCSLGVINKPTTDELWISPVYRRLAVAKFSKSAMQKLLT